MLEIQQKGQKIMEDQKNLKGCPLFAEVTEEELESMLQCMNARVGSYEKNQPIFLEGDPAEYVGIVLSGEVWVVREDYGGNRNVLANLGPGQLFGEVFACAEVAELPVSVIAAADCRVMLVACRRILTVCSSACVFHSRVVRNLLKIVAAKNLMLNRKLEITAKKTTQEKLMAYLYAQAKTHGSCTFDIPYDRQGLADYLGVERSAMSAELSKLRQAGKLEYHRNHFTIL